MVTGSFGQFESGANLDTLIRDRNYGTWFVMPTAGSVNLIRYLIGALDGSTTIQTGIYQYTPGSALLLANGSVTTDVITGSWFNFPIATPVGLPAGSYVLCVNNSNNDGYGLGIAGTNRSAYDTDTFPITNTSWTGGSPDFTLDYILPIYAEYEQVGGTVNSGSITETYAFVETVDAQKSNEIRSENITETYAFTEDVTASRSLKVRSEDITETFAFIEDVQTESTAGTNTENITETFAFTEDVTPSKNLKTYSEDITETYAFIEDVQTANPQQVFGVSESETFAFVESFSSSFVPKPSPIIEITDLLVTIDGTQYDADIIQVKKSMNDFNSTGSFKIKFNNYTGRYSSDFSLNDEVIIYADFDTSPPTTVLLKGVVEDIKKVGKNNQRNEITISGRDYGCLLQDILVNPRIYSNQEVSQIVLSLMTQNANGLGITTTNVNATSTTVDKITFSNKSLYDCISELAELAGYYFYVDTNKDLHFEQRSSINSGLALDRSNTIDIDLRTSDSDIANYVKYYGDRQLTGVREIFGPGAITGSIYTLDDKPSNTILYESGTTIGSIIQPGGVIYVNDPDTENVKWLVDYNSRNIILTSGTAAGDNTGYVGSGIVIDYQRSSPILSIKQDTTSIAAYGKKDKTIIDRNVKTQNEAALKATTYLSEHKDPKTMGIIKVRGVLDVTPGETCVITNTIQGIDDTYDILDVDYYFDNRTEFTGIVSTLIVSKKIRGLHDYMKEVELRLRALESSSIDTSVTELQLSTGSIGVQISAYECISRSIGSAFYFGVSGHNIFNSPSSLLGDMRAGSEVISYAI